MATPIPRNTAHFSLDDVLAVTRGRALVTRAREATSATTDSRSVTEGALFVALRGESHDAHAFVPAAIGAGAAIVVVDRPVDAVGDVSVVQVDDTLVAWGALARAHLERWRRGDRARRVVAITGSAGKTTTKELTAALLGEVGPTHFTAGNLNNRIGVPAVVLALEEQRFCVLEMGMSLPGELDAIAAMAPPDVSVVVNVGVAHSEGVGGREGVMREKGAVYRALRPEGIAIVNADDDFVRRAAADAGVENVVTFGTAAPARYRLASRTPTRAGSRIDLVAAGRELTIDFPLSGEAPALDFVAALAVQEATSAVALDGPALTRAFAQVRLEGRGLVRRLGDVVVIDDAYNANPASMRSSLATLAELGAGARRVAVLGEMKELGALAEEEHRALGDAIADAGVVLVIGCGGLVTLALERAHGRGVEVIDAPDTAAAAIEATRRLRAGDVVLVKASRSVGAEKVVDAIVGSIPHPKSS